MKILFFGSCNFSIPSLSRLTSLTRNNFSFILAHIDVISSGEILHKYALSKNLNSTRIYKNDIKIHDVYDFGIAVSFGYFIPPRILDTFKRGTLNLHPSLLPLHPGPSPIQYSILNNTKLGCSIISLSKKSYDTGLLYAQQEITYPVLKYGMYKDVEKKLSIVGANLLYNVVKNFDKITPVKQSEKNLIYDENVKYTRKIRRSDSEIKLSDSVEIIIRKYRAISHHYHLYYNSIVFQKIIFCDSLDKETKMLGLNNAERGSIFCNRITNTLFIKFDGWLGVKELCVRNVVYDAIGFIERFNLKNLDEIR